MNVPTHNTNSDHHIDLILTNSDLEYGSWRLPPKNVQGSPPTGVSQCNVPLSNWGKSRAHESRHFGHGGPNRKFIESNTSRSIERKCVFCKDGGSPSMRTDVTRVFLVVVVVVLTVAMVHAHMKLWRMEERLAEMESQRSGNNGKFLMFTDKLDVADPSQNIPSLNFPDQSIETDLMAIGDVKEQSARKKRDVTDLKQKAKKPKDKQKNNRKCNNKNLIDQYCFDKIEGTQPIYNEFESVFGKKYPPKTFQSKECYFDEKVPNPFKYPERSEHPKVCRDKTIEYAHEESPLAFYVPVKPSNTTLLNITSEKDGEFTVQESGIFLLQFSIAMMDKHHNKSIGVFVNHTPVLACPQGGYKNPKEKYSNYRLCTFNGILHMFKGSKLQLKTMSDNTKVRIEDTHKSVIRVTLLHRLSRELSPQ